MINNYQIRQRVRWRFFGGLLFALALVVVSFGISSPKELSFSGDPRFIATTVPDYGSSANATLKGRVWSWWVQVNRKFNKPIWTFPGSTNNLCSMQGLLNQCNDVTGVRYLIAKEVAGGTIHLGNTNTLNGPQWVAAVTDAIQNGQVGWWDPKIGKFRRESLVLVTNDANTILVIPKEMAHEFQGKVAK